MTPEIPDKERTPAPRRRWKPMNEPERRISDGPRMANHTAMDDPHCEMRAPWSGH
ncbi:MAG: hypothetical protein ISF22_11500 [Methanomassiliicoccus sp.]|nr:hypothetical protein [Methanomassiliicoccus sp.]